MMKRHLLIECREIMTETKRKLFYEESYEETENQNERQTKFEKFVDKGEITGDYLAALHSKLVRMIIAGNLPLSFLYRSETRDFFRLNYMVPSSSKFKQELLTNDWTKVLKKQRSFIQSARSYSITIETDTWGDVS